MLDKTMPGGRSGFILFSGSLPLSFSGFQEEEKTVLLARKVGKEENILSITASTIGMEPDMRY